MNDETKKTLFDEIKILPTIIRSILSEYTEPPLQEKNILKELIEIAGKNFCWFDCQGQYDPPNRLCDSCSRIAYLEDSINIIRKSYSNSLITVVKGVVVHL